jgi:hypothetical protein
MTFTAGDISCCAGLEIHVFNGQISHPTSAGPGQEGCAARFIARSC